MDANNKIIRNVGIVVSLLFILMIVVDRYYWAQIPEWREDESTNIWLGYTAQIDNLPPVGLISSQDIPNPNGMILLGIFLSRLPNLISISLIIGLAQIVLLSLVAWKACDKNWQHFLLVALPSFTSVILRSTSVEYWNQYTITLVNVFFIFWVLRYLEKPSLWNLPPIVVLILAAPALYLAGAVNAIVMTVIGLGMVLYKRPSTKDLLPVIILSLVIMLLSVFVTWLPYFENVDVPQIREINQNAAGPTAIFGTLWRSTSGLPSYSLQWADKGIFPATIKYAETRILARTTEVLLRIVGKAYSLQAMFAFLTFSYAIVYTIIKALRRRDLSSAINIPALRLVILSIVFISLSYAVSPWMGGANWMKAERLDQAVQYLPMFYSLIFLLPFTIVTGGIGQKIVKWLAAIIFTFFVTANLVCGFMIIRDHLQYRGKTLSAADVPLIHKMRAVDFIAADWKKQSDSQIVAVDYDLGGERWDWVPEFGLSLTRWYAAPMTMGRSFDYELLRRYGLTNQQEGIQLRTFGSGRYLVTYEFEDPPQIDHGQITHYVFGRLRVSIVEE